MVLPARKNRGKTQPTFAEEQAMAAAAGAEKTVTKSKRKLDKCNDSTSTIAGAGDNGDNVEMEVYGGNSTLRRPPSNRQRILPLRNGENQGGENTSIGGYCNINTWNRFCRFKVGTVGVDFCILVMMQYFGFPNGIKGWSESISVEIVIIDDVPYYKLTNPAAFGKGMGIVSPDGQRQRNVSDVAYFHSQLKLNGWILNYSSTGMLEVDAYTKGKLWESSNAVWFLRNSRARIADPRSDIPLVRNATMMKSSEIMEIEWTKTVSTNANTAKLVVVYDVKQIDTKGQVVKNLGTKTCVQGRSGKSKDNSVCSAIIGRDGTISKACKMAREQLDESDPGKASSPVECVAGEKRYTIVARYKMK